MKTDPEDDTQQHFDAWITKYAFTKGVFKRRVYVSETSPDMVCVVGARWPQPCYFHGEGLDWHRTEESARKRFCDMRTKKVASLKKQITKLQNTEFEVKE